jgi:hypothetical protein
MIYKHNGEKFVPITKETDSEEYAIMEKTKKELKEYYTINGVFKVTLQYSNPNHVFQKNVYRGKQPYKSVPIMMNKRGIMLISQCTIQDMYGNPVSYRYANNVNKLDDAGVPEAYIFTLTNNMQITDVEFAYFLLHIYPHYDTERNYNNGFMKYYKVHDIKSLNEEAVKQKRFEAEIISLLYGRDAVSIEQLRDIAPAIINNSDSIDDNALRLAIENDIKRKYKQGIDSVKEFKELLNGDADKEYKVFIQKTLDNGITEYTDGFWYLNVFNKQENKTDKIQLGYKHNKYSTNMMGHMVNTIKKRDNVRDLLIEAVDKFNSANPDKQIKNLSN